MIIELDLIQNFIFALSVVLFFIGVIFLAKSLLSPKPKQKRQIGKEKSNLRGSTASPVKIDQTASSTEENINKQAGPKNFMQVAQKHAKNLLATSTRQASDILTGARQTNEHLEEQLDKVLQSLAAAEIHTMKQTTQSFDEDYKKDLQSIKNELHQASTDLIENTKERYNEKLEEFTTNLLKNGTSTQALIDKKTAELLSLAESEIAEYKKEKLAKADTEVGELVQKVFRDVLRISIPENVHQELIIKSLEEAKKDGLLKP